MKKLITILFLTLIVSSCSNDDDDNTINPSDLIIGLWNMETIDGEPLSYYGGFDNDIRFEFLPNGVFFDIIVTENDITQGNWSLSSNQTEITINEYTYEIINLTNKDLKIFYEGYDPNYNSREYTFKKIE